MNCAGLVIARSLLCMRRCAVWVLLIAMLGLSRVQAAGSASYVDPSALIQEVVPNQTSDPACPPRAIFAAQIRPIIEAAGFRADNIDSESSPDVYLICVAGRFPAPGWAIVGRAIYQGVHLIVDGATRRVLATAPFEAMNGSADGGSPIVKTLDLDGDGADEIVQESWYRSGGDFIRSLRIYRREGTKLRRLLDQTIAWDSSGRTGSIPDPEDPAGRPPASPQVLLAEHPAVIRYRASWEIVPATAGTPPQLRVRTHERIIGPKSAYRGVAARLVRDCMLFRFRGRNVATARCGSR